VWDEIKRAMRPLLNLKGHMHGEIFYYYLKEGWSFLLMRHYGPNHCKKSTKQEYVVIWGFADIQKVGSTILLAKDVLSNPRVRQEQ